MSNLKTNYLGLELKNPVIVGASNLMQNLDTVKKLEDEGAAAVVYKSLFEEQIQLEMHEMDQTVSEYDDRHPEMLTTFPRVQHAGPKEHLHDLQKTREAVNIPVIGSLNAVYEPTWIEYAQMLEETGVDALELNFYSNPTDINKPGQDIENKEIEILKKIKEKINIPVSVKLSYFYANPLNHIARLDNAKVDGFVLFNRLFQPQISIEKMEHTFPFHLSTKEDNRATLRFAGLLYDKIDADICANTGIFDGQDVAKMLLAGAKTTQVVSTVYKNKEKQIGVILKELEDWMNKHNFESINDFRGKLAQVNLDDPYAFTRSQYVDILLDPKDLLKRYPMR